MTNKLIVLDASALLSLLQNEAGHEQVKKHLSKAVMSTVNFSETIAVLADIGIMPNQSKMLIFDLIDQIIPFDLEQAYQAALLRKQTKKLGLSFGDRACLSLALSLQATVLTADKMWDKLHLDNVNIQLIR